MQDDILIKNTMRSLWSHRMKMKLIVPVRRLPTNLTKATSYRRQSPTR